MKTTKVKPWRLVAALASVIFIACMWVKNDVASTMTQIPADQAGAAAVTGVAVTLIKAILFSL